MGIRLRRRNPVAAGTPVVPATQAAKLAPDVPTPKNSERSSWLSRWPTELTQLFRFIWLWSIPIVCGLGIGVILIYTSQVPTGVRWTVFGTAVAISGSAYFTGGLVGFLFGVPRTVEVPRAAQGSAPPKTVTQYRGNTNLEQVSDWLTKIIVGIGLVQIGHFIPVMSKFAESMKAPLGGLPSSAAFGLGLALFYALLGFFYFYFWSRSIFILELGILNNPQQQNDVDELTQSADSSP